MLKPQIDVKQPAPQKTAAELRAYQDGLIDGWLGCMEEIERIESERALAKLPVEGRVN